MKYEIRSEGIYEVAAKAVKNLCEGADVLDGCRLTARQIDELFKHISDIEEAALEFSRLARVVVAKNATTTSEETSNG